MQTNDQDRVIQFIAQNRFPFPGQTDWPEGYRTLTNGATRSHPVEGPDGPHWPDIVILNEKDEPCRLGEVEDRIDEAAIARWKLCADVADTMNETGVKNLFVYVRKGLAKEALDALDRNAISFAGLREYEIAGDQVKVTPYLTRGDRYDHQ